MAEPQECPECRCRTFAKVDEKGADGRFRPGPLRRCVDCKLVIDIRPPKGETPVMADTRTAPSREEIARAIYDAEYMKGAWDQLREHARCMGLAWPTFTAEKYLSWADRFASLLALIPADAETLRREVEKWKALAEGRVPAAVEAISADFQARQAAETALAQALARGKAEGMEEAAGIAEETRFIGAFDGARQIARAIRSRAGEGAGGGMGASPSGSGHSAEPETARGLGPSGECPSRDPWRPINEAPKDGTTIAGAEFYRWLRYKPGASKHQLKRGGRWQRWNGYGWDNAEPPEMWMPVTRRASGIAARSAKTEGLGPKGKSPSDAQAPSPTGDQHHD